VQAALFDNWVIRLPRSDTAQWLEQKVREAYDGFFNSARQQLDAPLSMLSNFGDRCAGGAEPPGEYGQHQ